MKHYETNSKAAALVAFGGLVASGLIAGRKGVAFYVAGFLIGGVGTAINAVRYLESIDKPVPPVRVEVRRVVRTPASNN